MVEQSHLLLVFHHCPKTAGTSFLTFLEDAYGPRRVLRVGHLERLAKPDFALKLRRWGIRCVFGHIPPQYAPSVPSFRLSFMRRPEELLVSVFCYALAARPQRGHREFFAPLVRSGRIDADDVAAFFRQFGTDNFQTRFFSSAYGEPVTEAHLERAMRAIDMLDFIGVVERVPQALDAFRKMVGIEYSTFRHTNESDRTILSLGDTDKSALVRDLMPLDCLLYEHAAARAFSLDQAVAEAPLPGVRTVVTRADRPERIADMLWRLRRKDAWEWSESIGRHTRRLAKKLENRIPVSRFFADREVRPGRFTAAE